MSTCRVPSSETWYACLYLQVYDDFRPSLPVGYGGDSPEMMDGHLQRTESGKDDSQMTQSSSLRKRSPQLRLSVEPDRHLARSAFEPEALQYRMEPARPARKKRGRHLQSDSLEKFLIQKIISECHPIDYQPDRIWVLKQAKFYRDKNNVDIKCSKGWLDKFMKRNLALINHRAA